MSDQGMSDRARWGHARHRRIDRGLSKAKNVVWAIEAATTVTVEQLYDARVASGVSEADLRVALRELGFEVPS